MIPQPAAIWYPDSTSLDALAARLRDLNPNLEERIVKARYLVNPHNMVFAPEPPGPFAQLMANFDFQSITNPAATYHVRYGDSCTCPDWINRGLHLGRKRICKHVIAYWMWRRLVTDQMNQLVTDGDIKISEFEVPGETPVHGWQAVAWQSAPAMLPFTVKPAGAATWDFPHDLFDGEVVTFARHLTRRVAINHALARAAADAEREQREQREMARLTLAEMPL